jgi:hypothetical protein
VFVRASLVIIAKIGIEKVQFSTLITIFFILSPTHYLFYSLFSLNIILYGRECVKEEKEERENNTKLFVVYVNSE